MKKVKSILYTTFMILACLPLLTGLMTTILLSLVIFTVKYRSLKKGFNESISMFYSITNQLW